MDKTTEEILWLSPEEFRKQAKFGDVIVNHWAGDGNPNKRCRFVRTIFRRGKMNGGLHAELISDSGDTVLIGLQGSRLSIESLPPQQAVSDEEIERIALEKYPVNMRPSGRTLAGGEYERDENYGKRMAYIEGARWMRDRTAPSEAAYHDLLKECSLITLRLSNLSWCMEKWIETNDPSFLQKLIDRMRDTRALLKKINRPESADEKAIALNDISRLPSNPSEAEKILRELSAAEEDEEKKAQVCVARNGLTPLKVLSDYRIAMDRTNEAKEAARKWCADNPVKADNTNNQ